jgi:hypothetical protein
VSLKHVEADIRTMTARTSSRAAVAVVAALLMTANAFAQNARRASL